MRHSIDYLNERRELKHNTSGGTVYRKLVAASSAPVYEPDAIETMQREHAARWFALTIQVEQSWRARFARCGFDYETSSSPAPIADDVVF